MNFNCVMFQTVLSLVSKGVSLVSVQPRCAPCQISSLVCSVILIFEFLDAKGLYLGISICLLDCDLLRLKSIGSKETDESSLACDMPTGDNRAREREDVARDMNELLSRYNSRDI